MLFQGSSNGVGHLAAAWCWRELNRESTWGFLFFTTLLLDFLLAFLLEGKSRKHTFRQITLKFIILLFTFFIRMFSRKPCLVLAGLCSGIMATEWWKFALDHFGDCVLFTFHSGFYCSCSWITITGPNSYKLGLGLWNHMGVALTIEMLLVVIGLQFIWAV